MIFTHTHIYIYIHALFEFSQSFSRAWWPKAVHFKEAKQQSGCLCLAVFFGALSLSTAERERERDGVCMCILGC